MAAGNLILIVLGVLGLYGLWTVFRQKGAAAALGLVALGAFVGYLVESADGDRLQRFLAPNGAATPQVVQPNPFVAQPAYNPQSGNSLPEQPRRTRDADRSPPQDAEPRTPESAAPSAVVRREVEPPVSAPAPAVTRREPDPAPPSAVTRHEVQPAREVEGGGVRIVVEGSWGLASGVAVESAIREALRRADWDGLHSGGRKVLRVRGSLEDRGLTLGQVPTAAANLTWSLESASGAVVAEGGLMDVQGTGVDDAAARAAALRRAAGRVASELSH